MPNTKLTAAAVEKFKPADKGRIEYFDALLPGFCLRVTDKGAKSFCAFYRVKGAGGVSEEGRELVGPQRRITLGQYPLMGLGEARDAAKEAFKLAANGQDPADLRKTDRLAHHHITGTVSRFQ